MVKVLNKSASYRSGPLHCCASAFPLAQVTNTAGARSYSYLQRNHSQLDFFHLSFRKFGGWLHKGDIWEVVNGGAVFGEAVSRGGGIWEAVNKGAVFGEAVSSGGGIWEAANRGLVFGEAVNRGVVFGRWLTEGGAWEVPGI